MKIAIHQPNFFPRLKVLQKLAAADIWVVLDNVQYAKREWQNRTMLIPIKGKLDPFWLSIPVRCPNGQKTIIRDIVIGEDRLGYRISSTFKSAFGRAPFWNELENILVHSYPYLESLNLVDICVKITTEMMSLGAVIPTIKYASDISTNSKGSKLMADICRHLGADQYLADSGATTYLDISDFSDIQVLWQNWEEPSETWKEISSWRDISAVNYLVREGTRKFSHHLRSITLEKSPKT